MPGASEVPQQETRFVIGALMLVMLLSSLSQTIVSTALPTIVGELGGLDYLAWIVTAYMLAVTIVTPLYGKLGDLLGRKAVLQAAILLFLAGSALCGVAQSTGQLIAFRAIQGLGGGGLIVSSMAAVGDVVSPRERGNYQGYFGAVFGISTIAGPLLGGYIVEHMSWRWIFYVNLPLGFIALAVIAMTFAPPAKRERPKFDYAGALLLAISLTSLVLMASLGGNLWPWTSPPELLLGASAIVGLAALIWAERRAEEPILPPGLFANRTFVIASAVSFITGIAMFAAVTFMPVYLQVVQGATPSHAGLALTPLMGGMLLTSIVSGRLISRAGRYRIYPIAGMALMTAGLVLMSRLDADSSVWEATRDMLVLGSGIGLVMQVMVLAVQNAVSYSNLGVATSGVTLFRTIGASLGVAGAGAIFSSVLATALLPALPDSAIVASDPETIGALPETTRSIYRGAYAAALHPVFVTSACIAAAGFLMTLLMREIPLRETVGDSATSPDLADSFAMPREANSLAELEHIIAIAVSGQNRWQAMNRILKRLDVDLSPEEAWLLIQAVRVERGRKVASEEWTGGVYAGVAQKLESRGLLAGAGHAVEPVPTDAGRQLYDRLVELHRARISAIVSRWSPEQHEEVREMLTDFTRRLIAEMPEP